jgi:hypothetical protein
MPRTSFLTGSVLTLFALAPLPVGAEEEPPDDVWAFELSIYMLGAGLDGTIGVGEIEADVDVSFSDIVDALEMGGMGSLRVERGRWAFTTDVIYMGLGASAGPVSVDVDQWMIEPSASFRVSERFESIVGMRYCNLTTELRGPFGRAASSTIDWWDPFLGGRLMLPMGEAWTFNLRADIGGFDVGSDFAWQLFPYATWQFGERSSMQVGYRWLDVDYDEGSGASEFRYEVMTQGPQLGVTFRF